MPIRKLQSDKIFDGDIFLADHVLVAEMDGTIIDLIPAAKAGEDLEQFTGILCPGFINCHCHLELSYLKGKIQSGTGLIPFLQNVIQQREERSIDRHDSIIEAEKELWNNGVQGVGDICNTPDTIATKMKSRIRWHNWIEVINLNDEQALDIIKKYKITGKEYGQENMVHLLTPHAPYSVSNKTFKELNRLTAGKMISIHNQESQAENELFQKGTGDFLALYHSLGRNVSPHGVSGRTSLQTWLPYFTSGQTILLVHNTFTIEEDIIFASAHAKKYDLKIIYCLCPNANLYIEDQLPPISLFIKNNCTIVLGTDSYGSNKQMSMLSEIQTIQKYFPMISVETILKWATAKGAAAFGWNDLGVFEKGARPGVLNLFESVSGLAVHRII